MRKYLGLSLVLALVVFATVAYADYLKIGMQDDVKTLNPFKASDVWSWHVLTPIYDATLYGYSPQTFDVIPWIAEGDPVIKEEGGKTVAYVKIKPNYAYWEDGTPVTAHDVAFTGNLIIKYKVPRYLSSWEFIEKVEAVDDWTVRFVLKEMRATFTHGTIMSLIVQKKQWEPIIAELEKKAEGKPELVLKYLLDYQIDHPVGNGPFILKEWNKGNYIKMDANKKWYKTGETVKGKDILKLGPYVDGLLFKIYKSVDTAILALRKGEVDYLWWTITAGYVDQLRKDPNVVVTENPENGIFYLAFNMRKKPFNDLAFRKAMAVLIDKEFIVERVIKGLAVPLYTIVPPGNAAWYNPDVPMYGKGLTRAERVKLAKKILKEAGYSWKGGRLILPDGTPMFEFRILTPPADYDPYRSMAGMLIASWWRQVGVPVRSAPTSFGTIVEEVFTKHSFDVYILGWALSIFPDYLRDFFHSSQDIPDGYNSPGYRNPEFDKLADEFVRTIDPKKQKELAFKLQEFIAKELPYVPLYTRVAIEAHSKRSVGWVNQLDGIGNGWSLVCVKLVE